MLGAFSAMAIPAFHSNLFLDEKSRKRIFPLIGVIRERFSNICKDVVKNGKQKTK